MLHGSRGAFRLGMDARVADGEKATGGVVAVNAVFVFTQPEESQTELCVQAAADGRTYASRDALQDRQG